MLKPDPPYRDKKYLEWVSRRPCCVTGEYGVQVHHLLRVEGKAMGRRSGDDKVIPLHYSVHTALHRDGNETRFLAQYGIDGPELAKRLFDEYQEMKNG